MWDAVPFLLELLQRKRSAWPTTRAARCATKANKTSSTTPTTTKEVSSFYAVLQSEVAIILPVPRFFPSRRLSGSREAEHIFLRVLCALGMQGLHSSRFVFVGLPARFFVSSSRAPCANHNYLAPARARSRTDNKQPSLCATNRTTSMPNPILQYPANVPPVAALVAARICGVVLTEKPEKDWPSAASATLTFQDKAKLKGIPSILRYIARSSSNVNTLYGSDPVSSTMVRLKHDSGICTRCDQAAPSLILTKPWTDTTLLPILYLLEIPFHRDAG
jgi:hypothetical protein